MNSSFYCNEDGLEKNKSVGKINKYQMASLKNSSNLLDTLLRYSKSNKDLLLNKNTAATELSKSTAHEISRLKQEIIDLKGQIEQYQKEQIDILAQFKAYITEQRKKIIFLDSLSKYKERIISAYNSYTKTYLADMSVLFAKVQFTYNLNEYNISTVIRNDLLVILKKYVKFPNVFDNLDAFEKEVDLLNYRHKGEVLNYHKLKEIANLSQKESNKPLDGFTINEYEKTKKDHIKTIENYNMIRMKKSNSVTNYMKSSELPNVINKEFSLKK